MEPLFYITMTNGVVLIHGYMDSNNTLWWNRIESFLSKKGHTVVSVDLGLLGTTVDSPVKYAYKIEKVVEDMSKELDKIDLVAHSMGGISARWYIEKMDGDEKVDALTTLGTPHRGTLTAYLGHFSEGGKKLTPSSTIINELNSEGLAEGVEYNFIKGEKDRMVIPKESAALPAYGQKSNVSNYSINCGHVKMILSLRKFKKALSLAGVI